MRTILRLLALALTGFLVACQTTGDPRQGGLFGWSEEKAVSRQQTLEQRAAKSRADADRETDQTQDYQAQKALAEAEVRHLKATLASLLEENERLESDLAALAERYSDVSVAKETMRELERSVALRREAAASASNPAAIEHFVGEFEATNQALHQRILFLLQ